jgi:perosamine synthetase
VGGLHKGRPIGSLGAVSVFSFYATKVMTTGHGGMVSSRDAGLLGDVRDLIHYDQREDEKLRYNYQMTSFQAALGLSQLGRLDEFISRRKKIADFYRGEFQHAGIETPPPAPPGEDIHFRFIIKVPGRAKDVIDRLSDLGVRAMRPVFKPLYFYTGDDELPGTKRAYEEDVSIPIYPALSDSEVERISDAVKVVFKEG